MRTAPRVRGLRPDLPVIRRTLRNRARYEIANNSYARGISLTLANDIVGTGPRLQMLTDDPVANRIIEIEFSRWSNAIGLAEKLRTMKLACCGDGEAFGIMTSNPSVQPASLDESNLKAELISRGVSELGAKELAAFYPHQKITETIRFVDWLSKQPKNAPKNIAAFFGCCHSRRI